MTQAETFYDNLMINSILSESDYTWQIAPNILLYGLQLFFVIFHNLKVLQSGYREGWEVWITIITLLLILVQVVHECLLVKWKGIAQIVNYKTFTIFINLVCILVGIFMPYEDIQNSNMAFLTVIMPSVGSALLVSQFIIWMNLLPKTSFYLDILRQSFLDIIEFMYIYIVILFMFAVGVAVVNSNSKFYEPSNDPVKPEVLDQSCGEGYDQPQDNFILKRFNNFILDTFY